jgi:hypothetical protein
MPTASQATADEVARAAGSRRRLWTTSSNSVRVWQGARLAECAARGASGERTRHGRGADHRCPGTAPRSPLHLDLRAAGFHVASSSGGSPPAPARCVRSLPRPGVAGAVPTSPSLCRAGAAQRRRPAPGSSVAASRGLPAGSGGCRTGRRARGTRAQAVGPSAGRTGTGPPRVGPPVLDAETHRRGPAQAHGRHMGSAPGAAKTRTGRRASRGAATPPDTQSSRTCISSTPQASTRTAWWSWPKTVVR